MASGININDIPEHMRGGVQSLIAAHEAKSSSQLSTDQFPSQTADKPLNSPFRSSGRFAKNGSMVGGAGEDSPSPFAHNPRAVVPYSTGSIQPHASFSGSQPGAGDLGHAGTPHGKGFNYGNPTSPGMALERVRHGQAISPHDGGNHNPPPTDRNTTGGSNGGGGWVNQHYMGSGGVRNALQKGTDAFQRSRVFAGPNGVTQAIRYTIGAPPMTQRTRKMYQASAYENINSDQFGGGPEA